MRTIACAALLLTLIGESAAGQQRARRAAADEEVMIILNHVKADKRKEFETFAEALRRANAKLASADATEKQIQATVRMIIPSKPAEDGTYIYVWIFDPVVKGATYSYDDTLIKALGEAEAKKYLAMNDDALARPQQIIEGKQSKVW